MQVLSIEDTENVSGGVAVAGVAATGLTVAAWIVGPLAAFGAGFAIGTGINAALRAIR